MNYQEIRQDCLKASQRVKDVIPCKKGNGECCEGRIPLTQEDMNLIKKASMTDKIPFFIIEVAKRNANSNTIHCPFLGEDRSCLIYNFRPLVCIEYGFGGLPRSARITKNNQEVPFSDLKQDATLGACLSCRKLMLKNKTRIPLSCLNSSNSSSLFVGLNKIKSMEDFVKEDLV